MSHPLDYRYSQKAFYVKLFPWLVSVLSCLPFTIPCKVTFSYMAVIQAGVVLPSDNYNTKQEEKTSPLQPLFKLLSHIWYESMFNNSVNCESHFIYLFFHRTHDWYLADGSLSSKLSKFMDLLRRFTKHKLDSKGGFVSGPFHFMMHFPWKIWKRSKVKYCPQPWIHLFFFTFWLLQI